MHQDTTVDSAILGYRFMLAHAPHGEGTPSRHKSDTVCLLVSTMPNSGNARRRARLARRTRTGQPMQARLPMYPPALDLQSNVGSHWIRNYVTVDEATSFVDYIGSTLLFADTGFSSVYAEFRLKRANVWYIPQCSLTAPGEYAFAVLDGGEAQPTTVEFKEIALTTGSSVSRLPRPTHAIWRPTEPSDREWRTFTNSVTLFSVQIATTGTNKIGGYCVYDLHVSFRGTHAAVTTRSAAMPVSRPTLESRLAALEALMSSVSIPLE